MLKKNIIRYFSSKNLSIITNKTEKSFTIQLNEPKTKNAISKNLLKELSEAIDEVQKDKELKTFFIMSSQENYFCTGANLKERISMGNQETLNFVNSLRDCFQKINRIKIPTFALIDGHCVGGGLELALACDFRIITKNSLLGLPETKLAIFPGFINKSGWNSKTS